MHGQYIRSKGSLIVKNALSHDYRGEIQEQKLEVKNEQNKIVRYKANKILGIETEDADNVSKMS
jgi:hypothetical protein